MRIRAARIAGAVAALSLVLAGCSDADGDTTQPSETAEPTSTDTSTGPDGGTGVLDIDPADVVAEATYTMPGTRDEVTVGVLPLELDGDVMIFRVLFTPDFDSLSENETVSVYNMYPHNTLKFRPILVDLEHLKEYSVISDDLARDWSANVGALETSNGQPVVWWGVYAAPEDDIETVTVRLREAMPEFTGVPIQ